jgi:DNA-binding NarL/FixJ family response regulator
VSGPRVVLADADRLTRAGVRAALAEGGFTPVAEVEDADAAVAAVREHRPDLSLIATALPGGGIDAARVITAESPTAAVVLLATRPSAEEVLAAVLAGASGYLPPNMRRERLAPALRAVLDGEVALPRRHTREVLDALRGHDGRRASVAARSRAPLTDREWQVLDLLSTGASSAQAAHRLRISEVTVRRHVSTAVEKLGVTDRAAALQVVRRSST